MLNVRRDLYLTAAVAIGAVGLVGCSKEAPLKSAATTATSADWKMGLDADVIEALSKLSDADRTAALKQKVCPVADNLLGSMGAPPKVTVEGREVFLCCESCEEELKNNPAKYLAKLDGNQ